MERYEFVPNGVCSSKVVVEIEEGIIKGLEFFGGCPGNGLALASLVKGMKVEEVEKRLKGIRCGRKDTSCPNELAKFLSEYNK